MVDVDGERPGDVRDWPATVLSWGRLVATDGRFVGEPGWGRSLERGTSEVPGRTGGSNRR